MKTDRDILYCIECNSGAFARASGEHARALVTMCNRPGDIRARQHERRAMAEKERAFTLLANQVASLASHGHPGLARTLLESAVTNANLAEQIASVVALDSLPMEAA